MGAGGAVDTRTGGDEGPLVLGVAVDGAAGAAGTATAAGAAGAAPGADIGLFFLSSLL
ncbi:hypothetical protein SSCG_03501 [Streptomyces clavuligerus]|nr:hypothetical protein SSCG_03501 [Streptomyces clavuligerus]